MWLDLGKGRYLNTGLVASLVFVLEGESDETGIPAQILVQQCGGEKTWVKEDDPAYEVLRAWRDNHLIGQQQEIDAEIGRLVAELAEDDVAIRRADGQWIIECIYGREVEHEGTLLEVLRLAKERRDGPWESV